jgi:integrase
LAATKRNEAAARDIEANARKLIRDGRADQLRLEVMPFNEAADMFIEWSKGEHRDKPNTWKRLRGSATGLKTFFGRRPLHSISVGQIEDFKSWRRKMDVKEVTLRHDLHCLSPLFEYGRKHGWCTQNPVKEVDVPSDRDAVRFHLVTAAEGTIYFAEARRRNLDVHDVAKLMLLQGPRPSEVMSAHVNDVDLNAGEWLIPDSKSAAGRRTLHLTPEAKAILHGRILAAGPSGWLIPGNTKGTHLVDVENGHVAVLNASKPAPDKPRVLNFVLYDFRHTFATNMGTKGCDIATLAAILGHANLRTVQRYIHIGKEQQRAAMMKYGVDMSDESRTESTERPN